MRPRISRAEAQYLVEVLTAQHKQIEAKQQRLDQLKTELFFLKKQWLQEGYGTTSKKYQQLFIKTLQWNSL
jgi:hypothetical protein